MDRLFEDGLIQSISIYKVIEVVVVRVSKSESVLPLVILFPSLSINHLVTELVPRSWRY